ncbi:MAG TPA: ABC transporter permease subunit [Acidimicrobiia bacterium]
MLPETLSRTLRNRRRSLIGWAIATVLLVGLIVVSYVAIRGQESFQAMLEDYPDFVQQILGLSGGLSITSPAGYLNSQLFANTLPLIFLIFLIAFAVRETAGEESDGTLDLALSHPITRERFILEKFAGMTLAGAGLAVLSILTLVATGPLADMDVGLNEYAGATLSVFLIGLVFGTLALALAASTGSRGVALGVSSGVAVGMFVLWGLAPLISGLRGIDRLNPFYWGLAGPPITRGIQAGNLLLLVVIVVILAGAAVAGFRRRDLGT